MLEGSKKVINTKEPGLIPDQKLSQRHFLYNIYVKYSSYPCDKEIKIISSLLLYDLVPVQVVQNFQPMYIW